MWLLLCADSDGVRHHREEQQAVSSDTGRALRQARYVARRGEETGAEKSTDLAPPCPPPKFIAAAALEVNLAVLTDVGSIGRSAKCRGALVERSHPFGC